MAFDNNTKIHYLFVKSYNSVDLLLQVFRLIS